MRRQRLQRLRDGLLGVLDTLDDQLGQLEDAQEEVGRCGGAAPFRTEGDYEEPRPAREDHRLAEEPQEEPDEKPPKKPPHPRRRR